MSWFAMLFSAGMGIGLVFWGAAEPLSHFAIDPATEQPGTDAAFRESMRFTFFHWGIHAWAIYAVVAMTLAYFQFRKGEPGLISATLKPIFGDRMEGRFGTLIDVFAVFATVVGVATTLGFGAIQINGGLAYLFDLPISFSVQIIIIIIVTILFIASAWSGIGKGIKYLSNINMILAAFLLILVIILGPTLLIFNTFTDTIGFYLQNLPRMSFRAAHSMMPIEHGSMVGRFSTGHGGFHGHPSLAYSSPAFHEAEQYENFLSAFYYYQHCLVFSGLPFSEPLRWMPR